VTSNRQPESLERRQFRALYRAFLQRFLDLELLSSRGDAQHLMVQIVAILAGFSFVMTYWKSQQYFFGSTRISPERFLTGTWSDQGSFAGISMLVTALFTILMWDSLFPDRRDCLILSPLPIRMRTLFAAKSAAIATGIGFSFLAVHSFLGISYPFMLPTSNAMPSVFRALAAYWISMSAASLFVFCALLGVQGIALHTLSFSRFARVSSYLQVAAFFATVSYFFLTPSILSPGGLADPRNRMLLQTVPSYWFFGLFQTVLGNDSAAIQALTERGLVALSIAVAIAGITYITAYSRHIRRVIESSGTIPADQRRPATRLTQWLTGTIAPRPLDRALFLFITRTLVRSRQHRMVLAFYGGISLAFSLVYLSSLLYPAPPHPNPAFRVPVRTWFEPNQPMLTASLVILCLSIVGIRVCFTLPSELRANWIFRLTETADLRQYTVAIRKSLWILGPIPQALASAAVFFTLWPWRPALAHLVVYLLVATLLIERSLAGFQKIPFTCSYLPGKANLNVMLGVYATLFMVSADVGIRIELWSFDRPLRYVAILAILVFFIWRTRRNAEERLAKSQTGLIFDELPPTEIQLLNLQNPEAHFGIKVAQIP